MKASRKDPFILTAVAAALLFVFGPARAQDNTVTQLTEPQSSIDVGAAYVNKDNQRFGEYTGLTDKGGYGIVNFNLDKRDDATGTWFRLRGRDLGYKDPELRLEQKRQGDWGYYIDYTRIPRYEPYTINTGLQGLGTTSQTQVAVPVGGGADYQIHTKRDRWTIGLEKALNRWDLKVRYRNDQKDGSWLWGRPGYFFGAGSTPTFLAKPIDYTIQQIDATAEYDTAQYQIRAGYYGAMFENGNKRVNVSPALANNYNELGLPPDNQSHQFYVTGGYNFTETTRGDFKVSYARATQDDPWGIAPPPGAASSLNARVDTTLVQAGVSGRATSKFNWRADLRYQNRDDKTPSVVGGGLDYQPRSLERTTGKVIGHYSLPMGFRLTGDITYDQKKREVPEATVVGFRERVNEATYRVELRRAVSETVTGALSVAHSKRDGSDWLDNLLEPLPSYNLIAPIYMADRDRNTVRLVVNWMPSDPLSLNFRVDQSRDDYTGRNNEKNGVDVGPREGKASNYSLDASYVFSESVTATAWVSHGDNRITEATCDEYVGTPTPPPPNPGGTCQATANTWVGTVKNVADNFGLGLTAKATSKVDVGAKVTYAKVRDEFDLTALNATAAANLKPLDSITTKVTTVNLYGKYALDRRSGVRLDYVYDQYQTDDWTWSLWNYGDGTTVLQDPNQKVNYVGVSYYYKFQ